MTLDLNTLATSLKVTEDQLKEVLDALGVSTVEIPATINGTGTVQYLLQLKSAAKSQSVSFLAVAKETGMMMVSAPHQSTQELPGTDGTFDPREILKAQFLAIAANMPGGPYSVEYAEQNKDTVPGQLWSNLLKSCFISSEMATIAKQTIAALTDRMIWQSQEGVAVPEDQQAIFNSIGEVGGRTNFIPMLNFLSLDTNQKQIIGKQVKS
jgi:hypothetical protein